MVSILFLIRSQLNFKESKFGLGPLAEIDFGQFDPKPPAVRPAGTADADFYYYGNFILSSTETTAGSLRRVAQRGSALIHTR